MTKRIFLSPPHMGGEELGFVERAFESNYIAPLGPDVDAFEQEMEAYLGRGHCVALSSGTAALHLALQLTGVGSGDVVLGSDLTFIASVSPVRYLGGVPVFVGADPRTWNIDPGLVADWFHRHKGGPLPKALVAVHLYGQPADIDPLNALCAEHGVTLVEDAAESLGATYKGLPTGGLARFGILSFNGNKIITTSGGGMLVCAEEEDARQARYFATQAREPAPHYEHIRLGYNYRMSNICAAIGRGQLRVLPQRVERKRAIFESYVERLGDLKEIGFIPEAEYSRANRWLTCVVFQGEPTGAQAMRERVRLALEAENIESRPLWKPMHMQPVFAGCETVGGEVGRDLFSRGLCLPSGTALTEGELDRICSVIRKTIQGSV